MIKRVVQSVTMAFRSIGGETHRAIVSGRTTHSLVRDAFIFSRICARSDRNATCFALMLPGLTVDRLDIITRDSLGASTVANDDLRPLCAFDRPSSSASGPSLIFIVDSRSRTLCG